MRGSAFPATGGYVPPGMPGHSAGIGLPYDPEAARQLLAEAGYPGGRGFPVVESPTPARPIDQEVSKYLQAQWRENLGVDIPWQTMEWASYLDRLDKETPHMFGMTWLCDYPDPDSFLRVAVQLFTEKPGESQIRERG